MGNETELTQNEATLPMTCQIGRKEKNMKKRYWTLAVALLLVVACCVPVSASEEAIGAMDSCFVYNENGVYQGEGNLWNDSLYEYTLGGDLTAEGYSFLEIELSIRYTHYDTGDYNIHYDFANTAEASAFSTTTYLSPNEGTPQYGSGTFHIGDYENSAGSYWNWNP